MTTNNTEGTWGHSSTVGGTEYAIFSVDRPGRSSLMAVATRQAVQTFMSIRRISYKAVFGCYDGQIELSYVIKLSDLRALLDSGQLDRQESVLLLGKCDARDRRPAILRGITPLEDRLAAQAQFSKANIYGADLPSATLTWAAGLGYFVEVSPAIAKASIGWTYDPSTYSTSGGWFICDQSSLSDADYPSFNS